MDGWKALGIKDSGNKGVQRVINGSIASQAQSFRFYFIRHLKAVSARARYLNYAKHNTKVHLWQRVAPIKNAGIGKREVFVLRSGRGNQMRYLEFGTPPHPQKNNPHNKGQHKGARAYHEQERAENMWRAEKQSVLLEKTAERLKAVIFKRPGAKTIGAGRGELSAR